MEENGKSNVTINISESTIQIAPNATTQQQIFYGDQFAERILQTGGNAPDALTEDEHRLAIYINKEESLRGYVASLTACQSAKEVGEVVATMCQNEEAIDSELIVKAKFIHILLPFLTHLKSGKGIDNLRIYINSAWEARKKAIRQASR